MPELPEVEIVKQSLEKSVKYKRILTIIINNRNLRFKVDKFLQNKLKNKKIISLYRKAKYLILELENKKFLVIHFGMSGTLHMLRQGMKNNTNLSFYKDKNLPSKHNHLIFVFDQFEIIYNDPRRFGFIKFFENNISLKNYLSSYALDPLDINFKFTDFQNKIEKRNKNIKNILLDQKIVSGIGNIYASEILFSSKINPLIVGKKLKLYQIKNLYKYSKIVLKNAILKGGSSIRDFKNVVGKKGLFQKEFKVYNRQNETCNNKKCNYKIKKILISNRSTFYCKNCQK